MEKKDMKEKKKTVGTLVTGTLVGAGLGILFAPKKGEDTRKEIKDKCKKVSKKVKNLDKEDVVEFVENAKKEIQKDIEDLKNEKALDKVKEKANEIKVRCDEVLETAKTAGNNALEKGVRDFKSKTVKVLQEMIDKLEA